MQALLFTAPALAATPALDDPPRPAAAPPRLTRTLLRPPSRRPRQPASPAKATPPSPESEQIVVTGTRIRSPGVHQPRPGLPDRSDDCPARRQAEPWRDRCSRRRSPLARPRSPRRSRPTSSPTADRAPDHRPSRPRRQPHARAAQRPARRPGRYPRRRVVVRPQRPSAGDRQAGRHPEDRRFVDLRFGRGRGRGQSDHQDRLQRIPDRCVRQYPDQRVFEASKPITAPRTILTGAILPEPVRHQPPWGKTFDRGHVMVALDYFKQNELARGDRNYLNCPEPTSSITTATAAPT